MRKCDICHTPIPLGEDRCPKCGYRYRSERKTNQVELQIKKTRYMSQFQPHPNPANKKASVSRPTGAYKAPQKSKKAYQSQKTPRSLVIAIIVAIVIASLVPAIVVPLISYLDETVDTDHQDNSNNNASSYQYYGTLEELEQDYPNLAAPIVKYQEKAVNFLGEEDTSWYESYDVINGDFSSAYFSYSYYGDGDSDISIVYSYYGYDWTESVDIIMYNFHENEWDEALIDQMATYVGANQEEIRKLCLDLYNRNKNYPFSEDDDYVYDIEDYGDDCVLDMGFSVDNVGYSYLSFSLEKTLD